MTKELSLVISPDIQDQLPVDKINEKFNQYALPKIIENEEWKKRSSSKMWDYNEPQLDLPLSVIIRLGE